MSHQLKIFWIGMLLYALSFCLFAVGLPIRGGSPFLGFVCAYLAFFFPFQSGPGLSGPPFHDKMLPFASLVVSGWINPVFIATAFLDLTGQYQRTVAVLSIVVLGMIPFCWVFFYSFGLYPREGHVLWIGGMFLVLLSHKLARPRTELASLR